MPGRLAPLLSLLALAAVPLGASAAGAESTRLGLRRRAGEAESLSLSDRVWRLVGFQRPPGDVSAIDDIQNRLRDNRAVEVAGQIGGVVGEKLGEAAATAEEVVSDPVGAIGGAVEQAADVVAKGFAGELMPTVMPEPPEGAERFRPESETNLEGYKATKPTLPPAPFGGVYCRGSACQYRVAAPPLAAGQQLGGPTLPAADMELCRGLGCPTRPPDARKETFVRNCSDLVVALGPGPRGDEGSLTDCEVQDSLAKMCRGLVRRDGGRCAAFGGAFMKALPHEVDQMTAGQVTSLCNAAFIRLRMMSAALSAPTISPLSLLLRGGTIRGDQGNGQRPEAWGGKGYDG